MTQSTDAPKSDSPLDTEGFDSESQDKTWIDYKMDHDGWTAGKILAEYTPEDRPAVARYLVRRGEAVNNILQEMISFCLFEGMPPEAILGSFDPAHRPIVARYLVAQGEVLRSEFHSEAEAEAFWAHIGESS